MTSNKLALSFLLLCVTTLIGCDWFKGASKSEHASLVLVNVLDEELFKDCHIKTDGHAVLSINVPLDQLEEYAQQKLDKKTKIIVHCANFKCLASAEGAKMLKDIGFENAMAFEGGVAEWKSLGYPVEGACTQLYLEDLEKPEGIKAPEGVRVITAQELKEMIEAECRTCQCC